MKSDLSLPENRAAFMAQYWGQHVLQFTNKDLLIDFEVKSSTIGMPKTVLSLRPISSLTEEEYQRVGAILFTYMTAADQLRAGMEFVKSTNGIRSVSVGDYLRSIGILIPYRGNSCEEIIESGCAVYRKEGE